MPLVLLGNKGDMVHLRQVSSEEGLHELYLSSLFKPIINNYIIVGDILAKDFDCNFREVAAADQVNEVRPHLSAILCPHSASLQIAEAFHDLCRDVHVARRKNKTSLLDRVLGSKVS